MRVRTGWAAPSPLALAQVVRLMLLFCLLLPVGLVFAQESATPVPGIGYPDVGTALHDLRTNPDVQEAQEANGWTWYFVEEGAERFAIWAFAPFSDPAYPAAVKRSLLMRDGALVMETRTMCQAKLASCDAFLAATEEDGERFAEFFGRELIANAAQAERERARRLKDQRRNKAVARSMYGRH